MWFGIIGVGLAASPWVGANADVSAQRVVAAPPDALVAQVDTTQELAALFPDGCVVDWEHGVDARGPARVTYQIKSFRRRLTGRVTVVEPKRVELDHDGARGFVTRFLFVEKPEGTEVTLTTFLNPPGWPLRKYYFEVVRPDWLHCWNEALGRLESKVSGG